MGSKNSKKIERGQGDDGNVLVRVEKGKRLKEKMRADLTLASERVLEVAQEEWDLAYLDFDSIEQLDIESHPFSDLSAYEVAHPDEHLLSIMMNPDYFGWTCSKLFNTEISPNGLELLPMQCAILKEIWYRPFPMFIATRGFSKSFLGAVYLLLRALFLQGRKIIVTGAGFRQSKIVMGYMEAIWYNSPVLREICGNMYGRKQGPTHNTDMWTMQIGDSIIKALPVGDGQKIRGQRANDIWTDEFRSIPRDIFEEVLVGFGVVKQDPIEGVKEAARLKRMRKLGGLTPKQEDDMKSSIMPNQTIISGTASYAFEHFYEYWKKYRDIIRSGGNQEKLEAIGIKERLDYRAFSIIRIPIELVPEGFMDQNNVERSAATMTSAVHRLEYRAVFEKDSNGFYPRSLIKRCTISSLNAIMISGRQIPIFHALLEGFFDRKYIFAVDTASEKDNFAITIIEVLCDHNRIVYCWTANRETHTQIRKAQIKTETSETPIEGIEEKPDDVSHNFYEFCARKIRNLMKVFHCIHIAMDSQGGGRTIAEILHNPKSCEHGELLIWELNSTSPLWDKKERSTDDEAGLHILEMVNFASEEYTTRAHNGLKHDLETYRTLFPIDDMVENIVAQYQDSVMGRDNNTLDEVLDNIEQLKYELTLIEQKQTPGGTRERWDVPQIKTPGMQKGKLKKDRASALIMAVDAARRFRMAPNPIPYHLAGGAVGQIPVNQYLLEEEERMRGERPQMPLYVGPAWLTERMKDAAPIGMVVKRY